MRAKKCDRCGKLYEQYDGSKNLRSRVRLTLSFLLTVIWIISIGAEIVMTSALSVWHNWFHLFQRERRNDNG